MKTRFNLLFAAGFLLIGSVANGQSEVQTIFGKGKINSVTGYGALSSKFTNIGNSYASMTEVYGGVFINKKLMIGLGGGVTTNYIPVLSEYSIDPLRRMSYAYGQFGLASEYVIQSNKTFHLAFSLFAGGGFTTQYDRPDCNNYNNKDYKDYNYDGGNEDVFFVAEPGVQVEINVFKWMRFSPGVSYRSSFGSSTVGLSNSDLSKMSYNATFKFGKF